jgi:Fe2+ transport system protein B
MIVVIFILMDSFFFQIKNATGVMARSASIMDKLPAKRPLTGKRVQP